MKPLLSFAPALLVGLLCAAGAGCGGKTSIDVVPVSGKVTTADGNPVTAGQISYVPVDKEGGKGGLSAGQISANGEYVIYTGGKEGAPLGKYKVTVTPSMVPPQGATKAPATTFNGKYANASSTPLTKEVVSSPAAGAYDLKLDK